MEILPLEVTAMGALGLLLFFDVVTWQEAISGFSNPAVITIGAIFIMSRSLVKTGFLEVFADFLVNKGGEQKWLTIFIFLFTVSIISGFIKKLFCRNHHQKLVQLNFDSTCKLSRFISGYLERFNQFI